jgi:hypothetical protein
LLGARRERRHSRTAEQRDELAAFQLIELHSVPCQQARARLRISNWRGSVSGYRGTQKIGIELSAHLNKARSKLSEAVKPKLRL